MATDFATHSISDLCLGKPPLEPLSISATVADALLALQSSGDGFVSIWSCCESDGDGGGDGRCVGRVGIVDVVCFWCKEGNLWKPSSEILESPVALLLQGMKGKAERVVHVDSDASLIEAIDLMAEEGAQNLVVPIRNRGSSRNGVFGRKQRTGTAAVCDFCWVTAEDIVQFLLSSISHFSDITFAKVSDLGLVATDNLLTINVNSPAVAAVECLAQASELRTGVAVVDDEGAFLGEISQFTLSGQDEAVLPAVAALTAGELMSYIDHSGWNDDVASVISERLMEKNLDNMLQDFMLTTEVSHLSDLDTSQVYEEELEPRTKKLRRFDSGRVGGKREAVACYARSSLVAVMMRAVAHRARYVWVVEEEGRGLVGIVGLVGILDVLRDHLWHN